MSGLWLPPGVRRFDPEVERVIRGSEDPDAMRAAAERMTELGVQFPDPERIGAALHPDSAVLLLAHDWGRHRLPDGRQPLSAYVTSDLVSRHIIEGSANPTIFAVADRAYDNEFLDALCPALTIRLEQFQVFTPLQPPGEAPGAPEEWKETVQEVGFALVFEEHPIHGRPFLASEPMRRYTGVLARAEGPRKVGRNAPCPCGSRLKYKKCCGR